MLPQFDTVIAIASSSGENVAASRASRRKLFDFIETRLIDYLKR